MIMRVLFCVIMGCCLFVCGAVQAHESRPLYVDLNEIQENVFDLQWKIPSSVAANNRPVLQVAGCALQFEYRESRVQGGMSRQGVLDCAEGVHEILVQYPRSNPPMSSLLHVRYMSGAVHSTLLAPGKMRWVVPEVQSGWALSVDYAALGVRHIWAGVDHLLFLVCLLMIAGTGRRILITVTGFTLAHSVTLSLATLGVLRVPIAPVEAVIALSIVFLAVEIVRGRREDSLTWRYPVAVSSSFGLLHGFGFASVLGEIGLPQGEIVNALLFFNVGVEIGQLLFIAGVIALVVALARMQLEVRRPDFEKWAAYAIGILAVYWMVERIAGFLS